MMMENVIIIGAGPAGIAAALQMKRSELDPLIIEKDVVGGLLKNAHVIENYPGFPEGISGSDFVRRLRLHLDRLSIRVHRDEVRCLEPAGDRIRITAGKRVYEAKTVLAAAGTIGKTPPDFGIPGEETGIRVLDEIYPILSVRDKRILIVGAGDAAFDYALTLSGKNQVTIFNRGSKTRCLPLLRRRAASQPGIEYRENTRIVRMESRDQSGIELACESVVGHWRMAVDYVIFAIGREANLRFLPPSQRKNLEKLEAEGTLFLAGDVRSGPFRQAVIAAGEGMLAGMKIAKRLGEAP